MDALNPWTVALLLIMLPPADVDAPSPFPSEATTIEWQALKDTAQLLDVWTRHGNWQTDYAAELRWCQTAQRQVYDAPPLADAYRLPSAEMAEAALEFNRQFREHLDSLPWSFDVERLTCRTWALHETWKTIHGVRTHDGPDLRYRRVALRELRDSIGEQAYYSSEWPTWVPAESFRSFP